MHDWVQVCANLATTRSEIFADMPVPIKLPPPFTDPGILFDAVEDATKFLAKVSHFPFFFPMVVSYLVIDYEVNYT